MPSKPCSKCGEIKDYNLFRKQASTKSGRSSQCKSCQSAYGKKRYANNSERIKAKVKAARDKLKAESPEFLRERTKRYNINKQKNNNGCINANTRKYQLNKKQRTPKWLSKDQLAQIVLFYKEAARLSKVLGVPHEVDHIVPLQGRTVSGLHVPWNLQILTEIENVKKSNNHD